MLKDALISAVREGQAATGRAAVELARVKKSYMMTPEGQRQQADRLFKEARETADAAKEGGFVAIERAIAELDAQEQAEGTRRAGDLAYLQRLESKLRLAQAMTVNGEINDTDRERLKQLFEEFNGDPLAVAVIRRSLGENKTFFFLPNDGSGKRQEHLKHAVKTLFTRAMDEAGCNPADYNENRTDHDAEISAFVAYCQRQDDYFTRPDMDVWNEIYAQRAQDGAPAAVRFDMALTMGGL